MVFLGRRSFRHRADRLAVWSDCGNDLTRGPPIAQWIDNHCDFISGLQATRLPAVTNQLHGRSQLDTPFDRSGFRVLWIRHQHLNPAMRIVPLEFLHRADQRHSLVGIEHRVRVMSRRGARHQQCGAGDRGCNSTPDSFVSPQTLNFASSSLGRRSIVPYGVNFLSVAHHTSFPWLDTTRLQFHRTELFALLPKGGAEV